MADDEDIFKELEGEEETPVKKEDQEKKDKELKEKYGFSEDIPERIEKEEEDIHVKSAEPKDTDLSDLFLKVEKLDGKLDVVMDFKENMEERIGAMSESIGELRSMFLEKEKFLSKVEKDVDMAVEAVSGLETDKIKKQFVKRDMDIEEMKADIEKLDAMIKEVQEENLKFLTAMDKVKNVENLVNASSKIEDKMSKIEETRAYTERVASKVEAIFSELNDKIGQLESRKDKIDKVDELTVDMVKMMDGMSVKFTNFLDKNEFDKYKDEMNKKIEKLGRGNREKPAPKIEVPAPLPKKDDEEVWISLKDKWKDKFPRERSSPVDA